MVQRPMSVGATSKEVDVVHCTTITEPQLQQKDSINEKDGRKKNAANKQWRYLQLPSTCQLDLKYP
jgi:hypothetical protein